MRTVKKILFVEFLHFGGSCVALLNFIKFINNKYGDLYECVVISSSNSIFKESQKKLGFRLYEFPGVVTDLRNLFKEPIVTIRNYFSVFIFLFLIVLKERPKIIHTYHYMWSVYTNPIGFLLKTPVIIYLCDVWALESKVARFLMKFNPSTKYIAVSKYVYKLFTKTYKVNKKVTSLIYDGVDNQVFSPLSVNEIYKKINTKSKVVSYVSRVSEERDIEKFIETASLLHIKYPDLKFYHWGFHPVHTDKNYFIRLKRMVSIMGVSGSFKFYKHAVSQDGVVKILKNSYLSIIPARQFALPNVAIQSLVCGTPVVAFNTGGNPEIIKHGLNGSLVEINSAVLYASEIEKYLLNNTKYFDSAMNGIKYTQNKFSSDKSYNRIVRLYQDATNS